MSEEKPKRLYGEVRFSGYSDDNLSIEGAVYDEIGVGNNDTAVVQLKSPDGERLNVVAQYGSLGMWMIGLQVAEEDDLWPSWQINWKGSKNGYSPELCIILPTGSTITQLYPGVDCCEECKRERDPQTWIVLNQ